MTQLLEAAISKIRDLPDAEQDAVAVAILEELTDEARWEESFAHSQEHLAKLAGKVRSDIQAGRIRKGGIGEA